MNDVIDTSHTSTQQYKSINPLLGVYYLLCEFVEKKMNKKNHVSYKYKLKIHIF